jgi:hypothetical protein
VERTVASLALSAFVASCSVALLLSWEVLSEPRPARAQTTGTCPNAQLIDTYEGTGDQQTDTFTTTTDSFRVALTSGPGLTYVDVINADRPNDLPVASLSQDGRGQAETFANTPPGTYYLDIISGADYTITVEQCEGGDPSRNPGGGGAPPVRDQYGPQKPLGPIDRPEGVIPRTGVRRVPPTGGPPYLSVGAVVLLGVALIAGRGVLRR